MNKNFYSEAGSFLSDLSERESMSLYKSIFSSYVNQNILSPCQLNFILSEREPVAAFFDRIDAAVSLTKFIDKKTKEIEYEIKRINREINVKYIYISLSKDPNFKKNSNVKQTYKSFFTYPSIKKYSNLNLLKDSNELRLETLRRQKERTWKMVEGNLEQYEEHLKFIYEPAIKDIL